MEYVQCSCISLSLSLSFPRSILDYYLSSDTVASPGFQKQTHRDRGSCRTVHSCVPIFSPLRSFNPECLQLTAQYFSPSFILESLLIFFLFSQILFNAVKNNEWREKLRRKIYEQSRNRIQPLVSIAILTDRDKLWFFSYHQLCFIDWIIFIFLRYLYKKEKNITFKLL